MTRGSQGGMEEGDKGIMRRTRELPARMDEEDEKLGDHVKIIFFLKKLRHFHANLKPPPLPPSLLLCANKNHKEETLDLRCKRTISPPAKTHNPRERAQNKFNEVRPFRLRHRGKKERVSIDSCQSIQWLQQWVI